MACAATYVIAVRVLIDVVVALAAALRARPRHAMVVMCRVVLGQLGVLEKREHHVVVVHWAAISLRCAGFS